MRRKCVWPEFYDKMSSAHIKTWYKKEVLLPQTKKPRLLDRLIRASDSEVHTQTWCQVPAHCECLPNKDRTAFYVTGGNCHSLAPILSPRSLHFSPSPPPSRYPGSQTTGRKKCHHLTRPFVVSCCLSQQSINKLCEPKCLTVPKRWNCIVFQMLLGI